MAVADDVYDIVTKINELKAACETAEVYFSYNEIPAGTDYSLKVSGVPESATLTTSSLNAADVISFMNSIIDAL